MLGFVCAIPSLESLGLRCQWWLRVTGKNTLSYALHRRSSLRMVQSLLDHLALDAGPKRGELVAVDSMPLTLPSTRRHNCRKINRTTVGGGILWAFRLPAPRGVNPVKILQLISGPWHDTKTIADAPLAASDRLTWSAEKILAAYKRRWEIEQFHRLLKNTIGLAHLYSFHETGIFFLAHVALLLAVLLFLGVSKLPGATVQTMKLALAPCRRAMGLGTHWKRNMTSRPKAKKGKRKKKRPKNH